MSQGNTQLSPYCRYIGRVGAMAAALGIGVMVITFPGVAYADSPPSSQSSNESNTDNDSGTEDSQTGTSTAGGAEAAGASAEPTESAAAGQETSTTAGSSSAVNGTTTESRETQISRWERRLTRWAPRGVVIATGGAHTSSTTPGTSSSPESTVDETPGASAPEPQTSPAEPTLKLAASDSKSAHSGPVANVVKNLLSPTNVPSTATTPAATKTVVDSVKQLSEKVESSAVSTAQTAKLDEASTALVAPVAAALAPVAPAAPAAPAAGVVGILNHVVTNLLNPFLAPAPNTPEPVTPVVWAVLGWVRRNLFNQAPAITYNPASTTQTGQTVTGNVGAADPEGDALTYTVTDATQVGASTWQTAKGGTVTIDQSTGDFTYQAADIDYTAVQTDSFTVSVTDGKTNLVSLFGAPHSDQKTLGVTVQPPTVDRVIVTLPDGITSPQNPLFDADRNSILFHAQPAYEEGTPRPRRELYEMDVDGTNVRCLTCGVTAYNPNGTPTTAGLGKMTAFGDGSGRIMVETGSNVWSVYEPVGYNGATEAKLVPIALPPNPPAPARVLEASREMRISPDGTHVLFSQIQLGENSVLTAVPIVGTITRNTTSTGAGAVYQIGDARVVYPVGEGKQFTHDGTGVIIIAGQYDAGNVDDILVDLATGEVTRLTANLDYDEDTDLSPNGDWLAIGSARTLDALTPMSRIVRPGFLPAQIQGAVYEAYANPINVTNQNWLIAVADDLNRENGIPLFVSDDPNTPEDEGDNYTARSFPSFNEDGTAITFYERNTVGDTSLTRIVIANLKYTTSVGTAEIQPTPTPTWAPQLSTYLAKPSPLPPTGRSDSPYGGYAVVTEEALPQTQFGTFAVNHTKRTVTYYDYVNEDGMILNGTEWTDTSSSPGPVSPAVLFTTPGLLGAYNTIHYVADIEVTGTHTGYLKGDVIIDKTTRSITPTTAPLSPSSGSGTADDPGSQIRSSLDGDLLVLLDEERIADAQASV